MNGFALDPSDERASLVGLLDELLETGVHVAGDLSIGLADVPLIRVALRLLVASEDTAARTGVDADGALAQPLSLPLDHPDAPLEGPTGAGPGTGQTRPSSPSAPRRRHDVVAHRGPVTAPRDEDEQQLVDGVARLVLTVVAVIHDLVERQAARRVEAGSLDDAQVERLGVALAALQERMADVRTAFGVTDDDLDLDLGPLGTLR